MFALPYLWSDLYPFWPSKISDQQFGLALEPEDLLQPLTLSQGLRRYPTGYIRHWKSAASDSDSGSTVRYDRDKFQANLDVQQFKPEEISVKVNGENAITIEGKHEEKEDQHGYISRHFVRKYILPSRYDISKIESKLSSDGVLTIIAPSACDNQSENTNIPIVQTREPAKSSKRMCDGDKICQTVD